MAQAPSQIRGIGGVFLKANDVRTLVDWYTRQLGLTFQCYQEGVCYGLELAHHDLDGTPAATIFSLQQVKQPLPSPRREVVINWRVANLDAFLAGLDGVPVEKGEDCEYGRFAWITDPEGNRLEIYQATGN